MAQTNKSKTPQKIILTAISLFALGCSCLPKDPEIKPKQILTRLNKCKQYKVEFGDKMVFKFEKDIPLSECLQEGFFVLTDEELVRVRNYYNEAKKCYDKKCKGK